MMLILMRKEGQAIIINGCIVVRVLSVRGARVRVGIEGPRDAIVLREEIATDIAEPPLEKDRLYLPTTDELATVVRHELQNAGGDVVQLSQNRQVLYLKSTLAQATEVRPGDTIQRGIAVRAYEGKITVHRYFLRRACANGLIMPQSAHIECIPRGERGADSEAIAEVAQALTRAVRHYLRDGECHQDARQIRFAATRQANLATHLDPLMSQLPRHHATRVRAEIARRFRRNGDSSLLGLADAVASIGRDKRDWELRWRLERIGGAVIAASHVPPA